MERLTFFRIEDVNGVGMYYSGASDVARFHMNDTKRRHPMPYHDEGLSDFWYEGFNSGDYKFAFSSVDQLKRWVHRKSWRDAMHNDALVVAVFTAEGIHGVTQAVYRAASREDCGTLSLSEI